MKPFKFSLKYFSYLKRVMTSGSFSRGFGMVEVVVSMLVLAVLSLSIVPVLVQSIRISQLNSTLAVANQFVSDELGLMRSGVVTCGDLMFWIFDRQPNLKLVNTGETLRATIAADGWEDCYGLTYPASVNVLVTVDDQESGRTLSSAFSLIGIESE